MGWGGVGWDGGELGGVGGEGKKSRGVTFLINGKNHLIFSMEPNVSFLHLFLLLIMRRHKYTKTYFFEPGEEIGRLLLI